MSAWIKIRRASRLVPLATAYPPPSHAERTLCPGATTSGLRRLLESTVTGPRPLKVAIVSVESVAPTLNDAA